jgi:hypothetical protein
MIPIKNMPKRGARLYARTTGVVKWDRPFIFVEPNLRANR